jgi:hypothetical protein
MAFALREVVGDASTRSAACGRRHAPLELAQISEGEEMPCSVVARYHSRLHRPRPIVRRRRAVLHCLFIGTWPHLFVLPWCLCICPCRIALSRSRPPPGHLSPFPSPLHLISPPRPPQRHEARLLRCRLARRIAHALGQRCPVCYFGAAGEDAGVVQRARAVCRAALQR